MDTGIEGGFDDSLMLDGGMDSSIISMDSGMMDSSRIVVLQTENGIFLRFPLNEIPEKKKNAIGVIGIRLFR